MDAVELFPQLGPLPPISLAGLAQTAKKRGVWLVGLSGTGKTTTGLRLMKEFDLTGFSIDKVGLWKDNVWQVDPAKICEAQVTFGIAQGAEKAPCLQKPLRVLVVATHRGFIRAGLLKVIDQCVKLAKKGEELPLTSREHRLEMLRYTYEEYARACWTYAIKTDVSAVYHNSGEVSLQPGIAQGWPSEEWDPNLKWAKPGESPFSEVVSAVAHDPTKEDIDA